MRLVRQLHRDQLSQKNIRDNNDEKNLFSRTKIKDSGPVTMTMM